VAGGVQFSAGKQNLKRGKPKMGEKKTANFLSSNLFNFGGLPQEEDNIYDFVETISLHFLCGYCRFK